MGTVLKKYFYRNWNVIAISAISVSLAGCASLGTQGGTQGTEPGTQPTIPEPKQSAAEETQKLVTELSLRVFALDNKLSTLNEKLESTRLSMESLSKKQQDAQTVAIVAHPTQEQGKPLEPTPALDDPETGFENDDAVQSFRRSLLLFKGQKYPEAILDFSNFLEKNADHPLAGSAQFYVGECYLKQKQYKLALHELQRVLNNYNKSIHIADTLRDMILAEEALKQPEDAAKHRSLLASLFPQSPAASIPMQPFEEAPKTQTEFKPNMKLDSDLTTPPLTAPLEGEGKSEK